MTLDGIVADLMVAATSRTFDESKDAWTYGWCSPEYRARDDAAISTPEGRVRLTRPGVAAVERAVEALFRVPSISRRWDVEEFWGVVAEGVATLPRDLPSMEAELRQRLEDLIDERPALVIVSLANVDWQGPPLYIADAVIGTYDESWFEAVQGAAGPRPWPTADELSALWRWNGPTPQHAGRVVIGAWIDRDGAAAFAEARQRVDDLVGVALLLAGDPASLNLHPLRGDSHKPGIRGLALHRPALKGSKVASELGAEVAILSTIGSRSSYHWFGEDPFPLGRLLANASADATAIVLGSDALARRQLTAARWLAKAHWAHEREDACLALGIALEALLADESGSPGRVLVERFALLEPNPAERASRARRMQELYEARSSVAHGSRSRRLGQPTFLREMAADVRWTASRMRIINGRHPMRSKADVVSVFDGLKWGTLQP